MRRLNPTAIALLAGVAVLLLLVFVFASGRGQNKDKLSDEQVAARTPDEPDERCAAQRTYDAIKQELFRRAAEIRGTDQAAFDQLAAHASVRMERPVLTSHDEEIGTIRCSGRLSLDLPPGVAVVGGRRTLDADIDYVLQPAADDSGDVVILEGADAIIVPLATLARSGANVPLPDVPEPTDPALEPTGEEVSEDPSEPPPTQQPVPRSEPDEPDAAREPQRKQPRSGATASPSFNCRYARTRGEIAVCNDPGLAALDRQMASQYYRAVARANAQQRELLRSTRNRFIAYRDRCRNDGCIANAYRGRMTEISDIMAGRWRSR